MAGYTLAQLLSFLRTDLDDTATPYLWSDAELYRYLDLAQRQFARDTLCFYDRTTSSICRVPVVDVKDYITLDERILEIRRAQLDSTNRPLRILNLNEVEGHINQLDSYESWEVMSWTESTGTPKYLVFDAENNQGRLIPKPVSGAAQDTLLLWVIRDPLDDIDDADSHIEVSDRNDQMVLLEYCKHLAYNKQDLDVFDQDRSQGFLSSYLSQAEMVRRRINKLRRRPGTVKYGGL